MTTPTTPEPAGLPDREPPIHDLLNRLGESTARPATEAVEGGVVAESWEELLDLAREAVKHTSLGCDCPDEVHANTLHDLAHDLLRYAARPATVSEPRDPSDFGGIGMPDAVGDEARLDRVWRALGCASNPDAFKPSVRESMWSQALAMIEKMQAEQDAAHLAAQSEEPKVFPDDYGWGDLMTLLDAHWPGDIFGNPATPLDDLRDDWKHDAGVRIIALLRWVDNETRRADAAQSVTPRPEQDVKAEAWDEGYSQGFYDREYGFGDTELSIDASEGRTPNPYRAAALDGEDGGGGR